MESEEAEGLFQISFFLAMLFFMISMFVIPNLVLMCIFLFISLGFMSIVFMLAIKERTKRSTNKNTKSRIVPYL